MDRNDYVVHAEQRNGLKIEIIQDIDYQESPDQNGDDSLFLVGFHRDFTVERQGFEAYVAAMAYPDRDKYTDEDLSEEQIEHKKAVAKRYHVFGLEAYIHSGVVLALSREGNFPDRGWDVSQLGAVFVEKKHWRTRAQARKAALSLIQEWNDCLGGNVYGFVIEGSDGENVDSCGGFVGDYDESGCLEQARESADAYYLAQLKKHEAKKKAEIKNKVPLDKRQPQLKL